MSPYYASLYLPGMEAGLGAAGRAYGVIPEWKFYNVCGFPYVTATWSSHSEPETGATDDWLLRNQSLFSEQFAQADRALNTRRWQADASMWRTIVSTKLALRNVVLGAVRLDSLGRGDLAKVLAHTNQVLRRAIFWHHYLTYSCAIPVGKLIEEEGEFALGDISAHRKPGAAPGVARALTSALDHLSRVRNRRPGAVRPSAATYEYSFCARNAAAQRLLGGYDLANPRADEIVGATEIIYAELLSAASTRSRAEGLRPKRADEALRAPAHVACELRDERTAIGDFWSGGIVRAALREAGQRLVLHHGLGSADDVLFCTPEEVDALLNSNTADVSGLAARITWRRSHSGLLAADMPDAVGKQSKLPRLEWLPTAAGKIQKYMWLYLSAIACESTSPAVEAKEKVLQGAPASGGKAIGTAVIIESMARDLHKLQPGCVAVVKTFNVTFAVFFKRLAAIVTETGGVLFHAAIVAREHRLPAVVGIQDACTIIHDGCQIEVDGATGKVRICDPLPTQP